MKKLIYHHTVHCTCIEHLLVNLVLCYYHDPSLLFLKGWNLLYDPNGEMLYERFFVYQEGYTELYELMKSFYGIKKRDIVPVSRFNGRNELAAFFELHDLFAISLMACDCPWLPLLRPVNGYHMLLCMQMDDNGVYASDDTAASHYLTFDFILERGIDITHFEVTPTTSDREKKLMCLKKDIYHKLSGEMVENIKRFAHELEDSEQVLRDLSLGELIANPLTRRITYIGFGRINYSKVLNSVLAELAPARIIEELSGLYSRWMLINQLLVKFKISKSEAVLRRIGNGLRELAENEREIYEHLHSCL